LILTTNITDEEIREAVSGLVCLACKGQKSANHAFCRLCNAALPLYPRRILSIISNPEFCEVFRSSLRHLQLNTERRMSRGGGWAHKSHEDLEAAGFRFIEHGDCSAPRCYARIVWYRTPVRGLVAVNLADYQPHRSTCIDPDYFRRVREARASRKRLHKRKRAR
jgi:hypothetical protein